jgi:hypothetical protein
MEVVFLYTDFCHIPGHVSNLTLYILPH